MFVCLCVCACECACFYLSFGGIMHSLDEEIVSVFRF